MNTPVPVPESETRPAPLAIRLRRWASRPTLALFVLLAGTYAYFYQAGGWNQNSRFDLVRAVVEQGTWTIDRYEKNTGDDSIRDGHYYCDKAPGASVLCMPTYWTVFHLAGAPDAISPDVLAWAVWLAIALAIGVPSAIAATFLARLALRLGLPPPAAFGVALLWGLGTMAMPYATLLYGNQLAASCMLIAFTWLVETRHGTVATRGRMFLVGVLLGFAVASEYPAALIGVPIAFYGLRVLGLRRWILVVAGGLVPVTLLLAYHWALFGSPLAFPYDYSVWETPKTGWFMGIGKPHGHALVQILFGEYRGLLFATPWLAAAVPGTIVLARRHRLETAVCVGAVLAFLWLNSSIPPWDGGWAAGPRYLVPMLPFLAVLAGGVFVRSSPTPGPSSTAALVFVGTLGLCSVANMFAVTAVKPEIPTSAKRPYAEMIWPEFRAGHFAVSTQSIDMVDNPANAPRQAWNLGMKAGLDGHASLIPLYVWLMATLGWLAFRVARTEAET
ncbi:MAG: hypothetical protein U0169_15740 [Polyangiaceae bacterium]